MEIKPEGKYDDSYDIGVPVRLVRFEGHNLMSRPDIQPVGRVIDREGGIIVMCTPHGTVVKSGCAWCHPFKEDTDHFKRLQGFEQDSMIEKGEVYGGRFGDKFPFSPGIKAIKRIEASEGEDDATKIGV